MHETGVKHDPPWTSWSNADIVIFRRRFARSMDCAAQVNEEYSRLSRLAAWLSCMLQGV
jgi:hypothetical protein